MAKNAPAWFRVYINGSTNNESNVFQSKEEAERFASSHSREPQSLEIVIREDHFMPAGEYIIGDLYQILEQDIWKQVIEPIANGSKGGIFLLEDGTPFAIFKSHSGNGIFEEDGDDRQYIVKSETIGAFPVAHCGVGDDVLDHYHDNIGGVFVWEIPIEACFDEGYEPDNSAIFIGQVLIHTIVENRKPIPSYN